MANLKPNTLHVDSLSPRQRSLSSGLSSACSSGSVSPVPIIPIISISRDGDESETESEIDTEPARMFHRRMSTNIKRNNNLVSIQLNCSSCCFCLLSCGPVAFSSRCSRGEHITSQVSGAEVTCRAMQTHSNVHMYVCGLGWRGGTLL